MIAHLTHNAVLFCTVLNLMASPNPSRTAPPTRDPHTPGYVTAT